MGPSGSHYIIGPLQKASGPRKKEKTAMSHFWDTHHTTAAFGGSACNEFCLSNQPPLTLTGFKGKHTLSWRQKPSDLFEYIPVQRKPPNYSNGTWSQVYFKGLLRTMVERADLPSAA